MVLEISLLQEFHSLIILMVVACLLCTCLNSYAKWIVSVKTPHLSVWCSGGSCPGGCPLQQSMMWAADFNENIAQQLEGNCLELLVLHLRDNTFSELREQNCENGIRKSGSPKTYHNYDDTCSPYSNGLRSISNHSFCGLTKANIWSRNDQLPVCTSTVSTRNGDDKLPVFCVAAILIINRQKIMMQTRSIDDVIKMFNDNKLKINVKRCVHTAIKLRKKYFYKDKLPLRSIHILWRVS